MAVQQGMNQQTPAVQHLLSKAMGGIRRAVKRRVSAKVKSASGGTRKRRTSGGKKLKFGSPAWQKKYKVGKFAKK